MNARNLHWNQANNSGFKKEGRVLDCESCGFRPLPVPSRHFQALCFSTSSVPKSTLFSDVASRPLTAADQAGRCCL
jgi:hypothetical protein